MQLLLGASSKARMAAVGLLALGLLAGAAPPDERDPGAPGISLPSEHDVNMRFTQPGIVATVHVKPGDAVGPGDKLISLDTRLEEKELEILRKDESDLPVKAAEKERDVKKAKFERIDLQRKNNAATQQEWDEARADFELSELRILKAKLDQEQAQLKRQKQEIKIADMTLKSQTAGVVETVDIHVGEAVDPSKPVITLVRNNPLWIEVHLPAVQAHALAGLYARSKAQDKDLELVVRYRDSVPREAPGAEPRKGKVIYFAPKADPRSGLHLVRLELPNAEARASGQRVLIDLPAEVRDAETGQAVAGPGK
jgi:RND family efflux transporter MFP subunit